MAWNKNGTPHTLTGAADTLSISDLTGKKFNQFLYHVFKSGDARTDKFRLNADSGANYAYRQSDGGGADSTAVSQTGVLDTTSSTGDEFSVGYWVNITTQEKLVINHLVNQNAAGAGNAPRRLENTWKHVNTSTQDTQISITNQQTGDFNTSSNLTALGTD